jgi:plasmid stabilization system protein ParE
LTRRVLIRPRAEAEILEARAWYDERQPGLGSRFLAVVERTIEHIAETPLAYPRVEGETRRALLGRFPYIVLFQARLDELIILRVVHNRRDPRRWQ